MTFKYAFRSCSSCLLPFQQGRFGVCHSFVQLTEGSDDRVDLRHLKESAHPKLHKTVLFHLLCNIWSCWFGGGGDFLVACHTRTIEDCS